MSGSPQAEGRLKAGKIAERLRGEDKYRQAKMLFVVPSESAVQIRINALLDGKDLIMPAPGMKEGFYRIKPFTVPFKDLGISVIFKGLAKYGERLSFDAIAGLSIDLLIGDCLAVDRKGFMVGDGNGFFDLACAIFADRGALSREHAVYAVAGRQQIVDEIAHDSWDVRASAALSNEEVVTFEDNNSATPTINWEVLPEKRIKKITPIWDLWRQRNP